MEPNIQSPTMMYGVNIKQWTVPNISSLAFLTFINTTEASVHEVKFWQQVYLNI